MRRVVARMLMSKTGVTTVEYAVIAAVIAIATASGIGLVAPNIFSVFKVASEAAPVD